MRYKKGFAIILTVIMVCATVKVLPTVASTSSAIYQVAELLGIQRNLSGLEEIINKPVTKQGISIWLGGVTFDELNNRLTVTTFVNTERATEHSVNQMVVNQQVYINGKSLGRGISPYRLIVNDTTFKLEQHFYLREDIEGELDVKVLVTGVVDGDKIIGDRWGFDFTIAQSQPSDNERVVELSQVFTLDNGVKIALEKYTSNDLGTSIYYSTEGSTFPYLMMLKGGDDLGTEVEFPLFVSEDGVGGEFRLDGDVTMINPEAEELSLALHTVKIPIKKQSITEEYQQLGRKFSIEIK